MHTRIGFLGALFVLLASTPVAAQHFSDLAPADEYFGHMKMSILGISNTIKDAGLHLDQGADAMAVIDSLAFTEDAIHDWERHYPRDPWIARSLSALRSVYAKIPTERGAACARRVALWLDHDFARSK
ncbi:MAG TPA: hypothetical protein VMD07_08595 [Candidatus Acidoferrales bacterium]|nr:hypothetical protein [Candidatus Acidoferrales bacterium]